MSFKAFIPDVQIWGERVGLKGLAMQNKVGMET